MGRKILFLCLLGALTTSSYAQFGKLKGIFDRAKKVSDMQISEEDEIALGKSVSEKICAVYGVQQDAAATRYVSLVGMLGASHDSRPNLPYRFIILDSNAVNAFAAPGGYIHITRGALASMTTEAQLAGVLGHEIAHVTEKHTIKGLQKMKGLELAEGETNLQGNSALFSKLVDKASEAVMQGFGRSEELEADQVGVRTAAAAGYAPNGLVEFLQTLEKQNEGNSSRAGLFASHPETQERIDKLTAQIAEESLSKDSLSTLAERFQGNIKYELKAPAEAEEMVGGSRGLTGGGKPAEKKKEDEDSEKSEKKKSRFSLSKLRNPFGKEKKDEDSAEVTGTGAGRGVGKETLPADEKGKPKVTTLVAVQISKADLEKFKQEGHLR